MNYADISTEDLLRSISNGVWPPRRSTDGGAAPSPPQPSSSGENVNVPITAPSQIDLSNRGLTQFPRELFSFKDTLEVLNLGGNSIAALPDDFVEFKRLRILFFAGNKFTSVPSILGKMPSLYMLSFKSNVIEYIPDDSLSPSVGWLILTDNKIAHLPASIGKLSGLRKLMLANNRLQSLPIELSECRNIELIRLSRNLLPSIPSWLLNLPRLSWIALAGNPCFALPEDAYISRPDDIKLESLVLGEVLGQGASGIVRTVITSSDSPSSSSSVASLSSLSRVPQPTPGRWDGVAFKQFLGIRGSDGHPSDEVAIARILYETSNNAAPCEAIKKRGSSNILPILGCIAEPIEGGDASNKDDFNYGIVFPMIPADCKLLAGPPSFQSVTKDVHPVDIKFTHEVAMGIVKGVASACSRLHSFGIMHGDVYAHNTHIYEDGHPVLVDLGASTLYSRYHSADSGLNAAEVRQLCERVEVRAFSCLVEEVVDRIISVDAIERNESSIEDPLRQLKRIVELCQSDDVMSRPSFDDICAMLSV